MYGSLIKKLWLDVNSETTPYLFKRKLGEFQSMFAGYN